MTQPNPPLKPSMMQIVWSMVAAFCGVQSNDIHDRDDAYIDQVGFIPYIIVGIALTLVFIVAILIVVNLAVG